MAKKAAIERIDTDARVAEAQRILRQLEDGRAEKVRERSWLETERFLQKRPQDKSALANRARLAKMRAAPAKPPEPAAGELLPSVTAALELLRGVRTPVGRRVDYQAELDRLADDEEVIRAAIFEQHQVVDALCADLSHKLAVRLKAQHAELVLGIFRAAQKYAFAMDQLREFQQAVIDSGHQWRPDLLPGPPLRAALVLGSEGDWNSEISQMRRQLEERGQL